MSSSIWTRCAGSSEIRPLRLSARRAVEAQHQIATRKLVDADGEQALLEQLIESAKPPARGTGTRHYLLETPFRYPPLRHGSRFGTRHERGIWYGAESIRTVLAEVAYYRLLFLAGTDAELAQATVELTAFTVRIATRRGIDLTRPPFSEHTRAISSPTRYRSSQALGVAMREAGVEAFRYVAVRDPEHGPAVGVFTADAFGERRPRELETWRCVATRDAVEFRRRDYFSAEALRFTAAQFMVAGRLPMPAL